jgi:hypothetical protein
VSEPVSPNPLGEFAATSDQVPLAAWSMFAGVMASVAWLGVITWITQRIGRGTTATSVEQLDPGALHVNLLLYGTVAGLAVAGALAYWLMSPIASLWRRGGIAVVSALAGLCVGMLVTFVARETGGELALALLPVPALLVAWWAGRRAIAARESAA